MSAITTHVLDTMLGRPASGIRISLEQRIGDQWTPMGEGMTDEDGRCRNLAANADPGIYRLTFRTGDYLKRLGRSTIYPEITITFELTGHAHYHLPLLLSDNCFTTYRGS
jgi:5-hydroxyisourate hydrolase